MGSIDRVLADRRRRRRSGSSGIDDGHARAGWASRIRPCADGDRGKLERSFTPSTTCGSRPCARRRRGPRAQRGQYVGQVQLALRRCRGATRAARRAARRRRRRRPAVDLADRELLLRRVARRLRLHDPLHEPVGVADDAAVTGRIGEDRRGIVAAARWASPRSGRSQPRHERHVAPARATARRRIAAVAAWTAPPVPSAGAGRRLHAVRRRPSSGRPPSTTTTRSAPASRAARSASPRAAARRARAGPSGAWTACGFPGPRPGRLP